MTSALQAALTLAEQNVDADPDRADALRLELLMAQALSSSPPKDLKARFAVVLAQLDDNPDHKPLLALTKAIVGRNPNALPAPAMLRDPAGLLPLTRLALAALAQASALGSALRQALATAP